MKAGLPTSAMFSAAAYRKERTRVAARDHQRHVVHLRDRADDTGQGVFLQPYFHISVGVGPEVLSVKARRFL